ncbi:MAG: hypothetical protein ACRDH2_19370 [Anaerolineales bacterium]
MSARHIVRGLTLTQASAQLAHQYPRTLKVGLPFQPLFDRFLGYFRKRKLPGSC